MSSVERDDMPIRALLGLVTLLFLFASVSHTAEPKQAWQQEWEKTVQAAKKEGRLNFYVGRYGTEAFLNEFRKEYPEIKVVTVNGTGNDLATRILSEVRAGKTLADLFSGGANTNYNLLYKGKTLDSIKDALILPEIVDESKWYEGQHSYGDPERKHIYIYIANPTSSSLYFNTTLASPSEFTSHWDLLNPKWKGKFVSQDPGSTGLGASMIFFYYSPELGPEFIRRLFGTMNVTYGRDRRQITDWLVQGKFAICLGCRDAPRAKTQGLPVDEFDTGSWKEGEGLSTGGGSLSLIKGAPHPNASKLFHQLVSLPQGTDRLAKTPGPVWRGSPQLAQNRYHERRSPARKQTYQRAKISGCLTS
jgi:ABC-type Fe3+ transport system substrate-binding protein